MKTHADGKVSSIAGAAISVRSRSFLELGLEFDIIREVGLDSAFLQHASRIFSERFGRIAIYVGHEQFVVLRYDRSHGHTR